MMTQLTTADRFEIVDAQYYNKVRSEYRDKTADGEIDLDDLEECVSETTEIRTDGGEIDDRTQHITDDDIEHGTDGGAIQDINKVREALETFQRSAEETWSEHMDGIEQGHYWLVEETDDVIVLAADDVRYNEYLSPTGHDTAYYHYAVSGVMHSIAKRLTDYDWGYSYPLVIAKPDDFDWSSVHRGIRQPIH